MSSGHANKDFANLDRWIDDAIKETVTDPVSLDVATRTSREQRMRFGYSMMLLSIFVLTLATLRLGSRPEFDAILIAHACLLMTLGVWAVDKSGRPPTPPRVIGS